MADLDIGQINNCHALLYAYLRALKPFVDTAQYMEERFWSTVFQGWTSDDDAPLPAPLLRHTDVSNVQGDPVRVIFHPLEEPAGSEPGPCVIADGEGVKFVIKATAFMTDPGICIVVTLNDESLWDEPPGSHLLEYRARIREETRLEYEEQALNSLWVKLQRIFEIYNARRLIAYARYIIKKGSIWDVKDTIEFAPLEQALRDTPLSRQPTVLYTPTIPQDLVMD